MAKDTARAAAASLLRNGDSGRDHDAAETPAAATAADVADAAASMGSLTVQAESVAALLSGQGGIAQAFQDMARGEVAMQKLERELNQFEARLEELLAAVSGDLGEAEEGAEAAEAAAAGPASGNHGSSSGSSNSASSTTDNQ